MCSFCEVIGDNKVIVSFPSWIEGGKENLEFSETGGGMENLQRQGRSGKFSETGEEFLRREPNFSGSGKGGGDSKSNDAKII